MNNDSNPDKVLEEVQNIEQSFIPVRWVINQKYKGKDMHYKARLVARGFEESNLIDIHRVRISKTKSIRKKIPLQVKKFLDLQIM